MVEILDESIIQYAYVHAHAVHIVWLIDANMLQLNYWYIHNWAKTEDNNRETY